MVDYVQRAVLKIQKETSQTQKFMLLSPGHLKGNIGKKKKGLFL